MTCPNCGDAGPHFVPPSAGAAGYFICVAAPTDGSAPAPRRPRIVLVGHIGPSHYADLDRMLAKEGKTREDVDIIVAPQLVDARIEGGAVVPIEPQPQRLPPPPRERVISVPKDIYDEVLKGRTLAEVNAMSFEARMALIEAATAAIEARKRASSNEVAQQLREERARRKAESFAKRQPKVTA